MTLRINESLSRQAFYTLLAVTGRPLHGYGVRNRVATDSQSRIIMAPGTVYAVLKRLERDKLVERTVPHMISAKNVIHLYQITDTGREALQNEMKFMQRAVLDARRRLELY